MPATMAHRTAIGPLARVEPSVMIGVHPVKTLPGTVDEFGPCEHAVTAAPHREGALPA